MFAVHWEFPVAAAIIEQKQPPLLSYYFPWGGKVEERAQRRFIQPPQRCMLSQAQKAAAPKNATVIDLVFLKRCIWRSSAPWSGWSQLWLPQQPVLVETSARKTWKYSARINTAQPSTMQLWTNTSKTVKDLNCSFEIALNSVWITMLIFGWTSSGRWWVGVGWEQLGVGRVKSVVKLQIFKTVEQGFMLKFQWKMNRIIKHDISLKGLLNCTNVQPVNSTALCYLTNCIDQCIEFVQL